MVYHITKSLIARNNINILKVKEANELFKNYDDDIQKDNKPHDNSNTHT